MLQLPPRYNDGYVRGDGRGRGRGRGSFSMNFDADADADTDWEGDGYTATVQLLTDQLLLLQLPLRHQQQLVTAHSNLILAVS
ncbi:hypothetical protein [Solemya velum gill symbiont]|uniref:hypothetical protein n=1 Tax=Solemya velum gill symbiont TaxID=2340 RepID=UPI0015C40D46|nr:hypothetical protein [Solemya velum gill symbiont]